GRSQFGQCADGDLRDRGNGARRVHVADLGMPLILAIDSDRRQSEHLATLMRKSLKVELVQATSAGEGLHALQDRVPDLILTSPLLSPFDDGVLDEYLRELGTQA